MDDIERIARRMEMDELRLQRDDQRRYALRAQDAMTDDTSAYPLAYPGAYGYAGGAAGRRAACTEPVASNCEATAPESKTGRRSLGTR